MMSIDEAVNVLSVSPAHRVLRRFEPRPDYGLVADPKVALFLDCEATGLNTDEDKIIQFAGVRFEFDVAGNIGQVGPIYSALEDPGVPLAPEIVELTGITDERVRGKKIDDGAVASIVQDVVLVIAHNADYDRKMVERRFRGFDELAWGCSLRDVRWEKFGCRYINLSNLLMQLCGEFFDAHDALRDCLAGVHVLATPRLTLEQLELDRREISPFQMLLDSVREPTLRLWAWGSPFESKDRLRLRRYRWDGNSRCWWKDLKASELEAEQLWLVENVYDGDVNWASRAAVTKVSAKDRYSVRA